MKFDLTPHLSRTPKWDFDISFDEKNYPTIAPTAGLVGRLVSPANYTGNNLIAMATDLFSSECRQAAGELPIPALLAAIPAYLAQFSKSVSDTFPAIAESVSAEFMKETAGK